MADTNDIIIIGNGPACFTAAIYAATANYKLIVIETHIIDSDTYNFNGCDKICGLENTETCSSYIEKIKEQTKNFSVKIKNGKIKSFGYKNYLYKIEIGDETIYGKSLIIDDKEIFDKYIFNKIDGRMIFKKGCDLDGKETDVSKSVFLCGSADADVEKEAIVLAASGCIAALECKEFLGLIK
ncbi:hypothetical protein CWI38_1195p0030 [Hamiltosporidium tvaerminnensis]|uniref:Thioredoxin reductase n=1 Tax=Hamiltosporidium tvaerminnensis TaxID=1176355 RepID=A0A4Q9LUL8_9MICR|nr:hypothetical protein CWI38_1195p0030 [Hamiltosporidium tvaerminnensis]